MNQFLTLLLILINLATSDQKKQPDPTFARDWKQADSLAANGLPKSALAIVDRIYSRAKAAHNDPQLVKAAMYRLVYQPYTTEDTYAEVIELLRRDVADTPAPARNILQSILAETYWQYYEQNRWKFQSRKTDDTGSDDPRTWDLRRLTAKTVAAYEASLAPVELLRKTPVEAFDVVVKKGDADARPLRPTLYDLLAHRALDFYKNTEPDITRPANRFTIDQADYLAEAGRFAKAPLVSSDSLSLQFRALALYQALIRFHQTDKNERALVDVDAARLAFVYAHSTRPDKDANYQQTLDNQIKAYKNKPAEVPYALALADWWADRGDNVKTGDWRRKAAERVADLLKRFPKAGIDTQNAQALQERLLVSELELTVESSNAPQKPIRALVSYRHVPMLHYRIIRVPFDDQRRIDRRRNDPENKKLLQQYLRQPIVREGSVRLPDDGDLQNHRTELALPALPLGHYVVLTSPTGQLTETTPQLAYTRLVVTNMAYLVGEQPARAQPNSSSADDDSPSAARLKLYVMNQQTGLPLADTRVDVLESYYDNGVEKDRPAKPLRTDANGGLSPAKTLIRGNTSYRFRIIGAADTLETEPIYQYGSESYRLDNEKNIVHALLFTDRAIYRPGQSIFFKGVLYSGAKNEYQVVANARTEVTLIDVNGETVASLTLTSNTFGTVNGQFTAPVGRLTGAMTIRIGENQTSIQVEEYKRPTFEVTTEPVKGSYKLGQPVAVSAVAKTFAGAVVDGASVRYRVVRRLRPRWIWWELDDSPQAGYDRFPRGGPEAEIASGTLTTNATGLASLTFVAQPDPALDRAADPSFTFTITIDVTDRTGETRSAEQRLTIGYSALTATLELPAQLDNRDQTVALHVTNAGNQAVPVTGQLTVSRLQQPERTLRKRLWTSPDRFALSRDAFKKLFPTDVYTNEDALPNWPKGEVIETVAVGTADTLKLALSRYPAGTYAAELRVTDATGERAMLTQYFTVTTAEKPLATAQAGDWVKALTTTAKPGQSAAFLVGNGGSAEAGRALLRIVQQNQVREERWIPLAASPVRVEIPVTSDYIGGFVVSFTRIHDGRLYDLTKPVAVPMPDKALRIETLTFRDQLKPGQPEQWTLRISGPDSDKLLTRRGFAETVATLYDASLDAFQPLNWPGAASLYPTLAQSMPHWRNVSFGVHPGSVFRYINQSHELVSRVYDVLNWPADRTGRNPLVLRRGGRGGAVMNYETRMMKADASAPEMALSAPVKQEERSVAAQPEADAAKPDPAPADPRRNFSETAFFFPKLQTDEQGHILLKFTMPDALTRWRLLAFAHTPDLKTGSLDRTVVTQKELMISANVPRFLREGDTLRLTARINNLTPGDRKTLSGTARIDAIDPATGQLITAKLIGGATSQAFTVAAAQSTVMTWALVVPQELENVTFRVSAQAGDFTDAEERTVPVLPNRMLVLDSQPFYVNGSDQKEIRLKALASHNPELPLSAERLTVELTSNPVWTALQSLPYLADFPYECAEQLFSRYYANTLASHIVNARPEIRAVAETWARQAPVNPLEANAELKSVTLDETPWRRDARSQTRQQAQIGQFLQTDNLLAGQQTALDKLRQLQTQEGGFVWFSGMPIDRTISLHILTGFGHLAKLGVVLPASQQPIVANLQSRALQWVDQQAQQWVEQQTRTKQGDYTGFWPVQYLYARSFYPAQPIADKSVRDDLQARITKDWQKQTIYGQALTALALHRLGDRQTPVAILKSLTERAARSEEQGMFWPDNKAGYFWQQAPIETQALLIEAYAEITRDTQAVEAMKHWLLNQKRTQAWPSTKATTEAIYALLVSPSSGEKGKSVDWLDPKATTELRIGGKVIGATAEGVTGYRKVTYAPADIKPELGVVTVSKAGGGPAWGGIYYQHFEPLDRVLPSSETKAAMGNLTLTKQLFVEHDSPAGPVSQPVTAKTALKPGDRLRVRIEVRNDRDMQYVHLKDSRASGFEPAATLSGYRYQNGLGYYEAPRDASTDFYLNSLPAGTHVFEYVLRVVHTGDFSTGVASIQCFYAPEFAARSAGGRVHVPANSSGR